MKRGRMSKIEHDYIKSNATTRSYVEIAKELNRDPEAVKKAIEDLGLKADLSTTTFQPFITSRLQDKSFYKALTKQFDQEELEHFEKEWEEIYNQFNGDVLPTEELQIVDAIRTGLLINRNLQEQYSTKKQMGELNSELETLLIENENEEDKSLKQQRNQQMDLIRQQLSFIVAGLGALSKDYKEHLARKLNILEGLKATRKDRISKVESSKKNFNAWMEELITKPEIRREVGLMMEKMRLANITEKIRLAAYHKYDDGEVDQPLLTPETVKDDNV